jgi:hypothetical protein
MELLTYSNVPASTDQCGFRIREYEALGTFCSCPVTRHEMMEATG